MALPYPIPDPATGDWNAFALKRNLEYLDTKIPPNLTASIGIYRNLPTQGGSTGADTNETTIDTFIMPANFLAVRDDTLLLQAKFATAANGNTKRFRLRFGSTIIVDSGAAVMNSACGVLYAMVSRSAGTALQANMAYLLWSTTAASTPTMATFVISTTEDMTAPVVVQWTMQNGAANAADCTGYCLTVQKIPARF